MKKIQFVFFCYITFSAISFAMADEFLSCPLRVNYSGLGENTRITKILSGLGYKISKDSTGLTIDANDIIRDQRRNINKIIIAAHIVNNKADQKIPLADANYTGYFFSTDQPERLTERTNEISNAAAYTVLNKLPACNSIIDELNKVKSASVTVVEDGKRIAKDSVAELNTNDVQTNHSASK